MSDGRLPDNYDAVVSCDRLRHGKHNVRVSSPSGNLKRSIEKDGIEKPLITRRPSADSELLHVTDGWQRYQAAVELGWQELPVNIYEDTMAALEAAERNSIVDEWTTFQAASHVSSLYQELPTDDTNEAETIAHISDRTARSEQTVYRYLNALNLPEVLHPLLKKRANITEAEWQALENYRDDVRQYDGISWQVAAEAGQRAADVDDERLIRIMLATLGYTSTNGIELVQELINDPDKSIRMAEFSLFSGVAPEEERLMHVPQFSLTIKEEKKSAVLDYCHANRMHLSDVVEQRVREFAEQVEDDADSNKSLEQFN
jgi:ParB/RepB/Spo0J family partition protein